MVRARGQGTWSGHVLSPCFLFDAVYIVVGNIGVHLQCNTENLYIKLRIYRRDLKIFCVLQAGNILIKSYDCRVICEGANLTTVLLFVGEHEVPNIYRKTCQSFVRSAFGLRTFSNSTLVIASRYTLMNPRNKLVSNMPNML